MKRTILLLFILCFSILNAQQKINPQHIEIVRDSFGVPHIYAKTDAEVAYGLAFANAEDDYKTIQTSLMAGKAMLGRYKGQAGAKIDYVVNLLRIKELVEAQYESDISPQYKKLLEGYCEGLNAFAKKYPEKVLMKKLFPVTPKDILAFSVLQLNISSGVDKALGRILNGTIPPAIDLFKPVASNAYAFNSTKTIDGNVYLALNTHQPLEGPVSWYEAHLISEEGWNMLGALFPGSPTLLTGVNENLGWAHTVNNPDKLDVYQLEMNPSNKTQYKFDGEWMNLEETTAKLKVKVGPLKIGIKKKVYWSKYGPTLLKDDKAFSFRTGSLFEIRGLEQWYRMNKAKNFTEFRNAYEMNAIPGYNVMYADKYDTIFYLSNAIMPFRNKEYDWKKTLPGNTSKTLWTTYHPVKDLPQQLNPKSGYLFNSNHSPYNSSANTDNLQRKNYDPTMGYETHENNRSLRFIELMKGRDKISFEDFKKIKYDLQLPAKISYATNTDTLFLLNENEYPDIKEQIITLKKWDHKANIESEGATLMAIIFYYVVDKTAKGNTDFKTLTKEKTVEVLNFAKNYLQINFGKTNVALGEYQKLVRGDKAIPLPGLPDVISSMDSAPYKNGMVKGRHGESYIQLTKFTKDGPEIETIISYGSSNIPGSKHYDDQMELFTNQKTKKMSLKKEDVYRNAERIYHPF